MTGTCADCGHDAGAHARYRPGSDCPACDACLRFRVASRVNLVIGVLRVLLLVLACIVIGWLAVPWLPRP